MAVDVRGKACAYLRNGKVTVTRAEGGNDLADYIEAHVKGHFATYHVLLHGGVWTCPCGRPDSCAHVGAVQLVTGHPGVARKEER